MKGELFYMGMKLGLSLEGKNVDGVGE